MLKILKRELFFFLYRVIGYHLPASNTKFKFGFNFIRVFLSKNFIKSAGKGIVIQRAASLSKDLSLGENSIIGIRNEIGAKVVIGDNTMLGPEVLILTRNHRHNRIDIPMMDQGSEENQEVIIGNDVWIGARAIILPGVSIGNGSIVGAGAVVSKNVEEYSIVVGNPARIVRKRN